MMWMWIFICNKCLCLCFRGVYFLWRQHLSHVEIPSSPRGVSTWVLHHPEQSPETAANHLAVADGSGEGSLACGAGCFHCECRRSVWHPIRYIWSGFYSWEARGLAFLQIGKPHFPSGTFKSISRRMRWSLSGPNDAQIARESWISWQVFCKYASRVKSKPIWGRDTHRSQAGEPSPGGAKQAVGSPAPGGRRKARLAAQPQPSKASPPPQPPRGPSAPAPWVRVPSDGSWLPGPALPPWRGGTHVVPGPKELLAQAVPWQKVKRHQGGDCFFKGRKMSIGARRDLLRFSDSVPTASLPCVGG